MKKTLRYIRYRICRAIYYADQCPIDCRKNYREIAEGVIQGALMVYIVSALFLFILIFV